MSAIFGFLDRGVHRDDQGVERILGAMAEPAMVWGTDRHLCREGPLAAGVALSSAVISPISPFAHPRWPALTVVADVSLYAREELRAKLRMGASDEGPAGDVQLLLAAYARWGEACVDYLEGAFAFALWDSNRRRLFCARDHIGERPFYYHASPERFVFGTDVGSVLAGPGVPSERDLEVVAAHYVRAYRLIRGRSYFRGIERLLPGHTLAVEGDGLHVRRWWSPAARELHLSGIEDYAAALRSEIERAVAIRIEGATLVGVHLSGGLDSSCVAAMAARHCSVRGKTPPLGFSWTPSIAGREGTDEAALVRAVCEDNGIECHFTDFDSGDMLRSWVRDFTLLPTATQVEEQVVCRSAGEKGVDLLLTGWGGDEGPSFNGRGYLAELAVGGRWRTLLREVRVSGRGRPWRALKILWSQAIVPALPDFLILPLLWLHPQSLRARKELRKLAEADPELASKVASAFRAHDRVRERRGTRRNLWELINHGHLAYRLEAWARLGAEHGVVYRHPLLDRRVLELCLAMPSGVWRQGRSTRWLFRTMCSDLLPPLVLREATKRDPALIRAREESRLEVMTQCAELVSSPDPELARRARLLQAIGHAP